MAKKRNGMYSLISRSIWREPWFRKLPDERVVIYFYLRGNEAISKTGIYELDFELGAFECGQGVNVFIAALEHFAELGHIGRDGQWIWVKDFTGTQGYSGDALRVTIDEAVELASVTFLAHEWLEMYAPGITTAPLALPQSNNRGVPDGGKGQNTLGLAGAARANTPPGTRRATGGGTEGGLKKQHQKQQQQQTTGGDRAGSRRLEAANGMLAIVARLLARGFVQADSERRSPAAVAAGLQRSGVEPEDALAAWEWAAGQEFWPPALVKLSSFANGTRHTEIFNQWVRAGRPRTEQADSRAVGVDPRDIAGVPVIGDAK